MSDPEWSVKARYMYGVQFFEIGYLKDGKVITEPYYYLDDQGDPQPHCSIPNMNLVAASHGNGRLLPPAVSVEAVRARTGRRRVRPNELRSWEDVDNHSEYAYMFRQADPFLRRSPGWLPNPEWCYLPLPGLPPGCTDICWYREMNLSIFRSFTTHFGDPKSPRLVSAAFEFFRNVRRVGFVFNSEAYRGFTRKIKVGNSEMMEFVSTNSQIWRMIDEHGLAYAPAHFPNLVTFYLIVPFVRRKRTSFGPTNLQGREKFYGDGCTIFEIWENDPDWTTEPSKLDNLLGEKNYPSNVWQVQKILKSSFVSVHKAKKMFGDMLQNPDGYDQTWTFSVTGNRSVDGGINPMAGWASKGTAATHQLDYDSLPDSAEQSTPKIVVLGMIRGYHQ